MVRSLGVGKTLDDYLTEEQKHQLTLANIYRVGKAATVNEGERMDRSLDINRNFWSRFGSTLSGKGNELLQSGLDAVSEFWRGDTSTSSPINEQKGITEPEPHPTSAAPAGYDDPDLTALLNRIAAPLPDLGTAAFLKPLQDITESEMKAMINTAQTAFRGWRYGDPLKARLYERVQEWFEDVYGDQATPRRPIQEQAAINTTPDGQDLWQASAGIGQVLAQTVRVRTP